MEDNFSFFPIFRLPMEILKILFGKAIQEAGQTNLALVLDSWEV